MENEFKIGMRTFLSAFILLFALLIGAGILTRVLPTGSYDYIEMDGRKTVVADSFEFTDVNLLPVYKWFTAPVESLFGEEGLIVIVIILFLLIVGGSLAILNETGVLKSIIGSVVSRFKSKPYLLMRLLILMFMSMGAFVGIFEEVVPLVPLVVTLSLAMGFDVMTGLGMSLLAAGFGFSAAVSNPFTIGVAQKLAELPVFSGALYRLVIFAVINLVYSEMMIRYARHHQFAEVTESDMRIEGNQLAVQWFAGAMAVMLILVLMSPVVPLISSYNLPIIALLFLVAGIGSGLLSGEKLPAVFKTFLKGAAAMMPGVVLILLATGVKHVIQTGNIMDTILYYFAEGIVASSPMAALLTIYGLVLVMNFFIGSGSAKAFIIMPIVVPLFEMMGLSRQMAVLTFQFGDGFSNLLYPTNAVLLIGIGLAGVSYIKWFRWVLKFQAVMFLLSLVFIAVGLLIGY